MANGPTRALGGVHDRPRLGEFLVASGYITPAQLEVALREQSSWGGRLGQALVDEGLIDERTLAEAIGRQLYLRVADLDASPPPSDVVRLLPVSVAERYGLVATAVSPDRIVVACVDPTNNDAMREVRRVTGRQPEACVATASQIDRVVQRCYYGDTAAAPSPDPQLHVTRGAVAAPPEDRRMEGLERRLDQLLDLVSRGS